jgi:hypothetical protein
MLMPSEVLKGIKRLNIWERLVVKEELFGPDAK